MIDERKLIFSKIDDIVLSIKRGRNISFTSFLSVDESAAVLPYLNRVGIKSALYGGYDDAERCVVGLSATDELYDYLFPIEILRFKQNMHQQISHRDVLGSLMSIGLKREMFGDIIFYDNWWYIFCIDKISDYVVQNLLSVKNISVSLEKYIGEIEFKRSYEEMNLIIASMRLDCIVSEAIHVSRTLAAELIIGGNVVLNGTVCLKKDNVIKEGDILSIKRKGKYRIFEHCGNTKKGRIKIKIFKYI